MTRRQTADYWCHKARHRFYELTSGGVARWQQERKRRASVRRKKAAALRDCLAGRDGK